MSGFATIDDLKQGKADDNKGPVLDVSPGDAGEKFGKKMNEIKDRELEVEAMRLAASIGIPHIDLKQFPVSHEALKQIDRQTAEKLSVVCFYADQDEMRIGALDPSSSDIKQIVEDIAQRRHAHVTSYVISQVSLRRVLKLYDTLPNIKPITKDIEIKAEDLDKVAADVTDFSSVQVLLNEGTLTDMVTILLGAGMKVDASDIHVEIEDNDVVVRFRLDGILHDVATLPKEIFPKLISRIKLISSLKLNVVSKPQDGRFTIKKEGGDVDVRVSTIPTIFGESIVMRLLDQSQEGLTLESLGLSDRDYKVLSEEISRPNGMIITTGPTGSGKTTTLYAVLQILNKPGVKIITLEDPVEYRMDGINQSQIDHSKDYTFAKGLRSILRQDPDIVMVGEIRDAETTEIAVQAALTGHLMLSTIHTNSAFGAIPRFLSMGSQPFLLAPALNCLMGQRLVRRVCPHCRKEVNFSELKDYTKKRLQEQYEKMPEDIKQTVSIEQNTFFEAQGCDECSGLGYKGRIGIYEIFVVNEEMEKIILAGQVSELLIEETARSQGMTTMVQDGILKAIQGITTVDEVFRVID